jgi:hypothetical protein
MTIDTIILISFGLLVLAALYVFLKKMKEEREFLFKQF